MIFVGQTKGETETPKEDKAKGEKEKKEKTKDKKESSKSSKAKKEKGEEKDIYFIITYKLKKKEPIEELTYTEECESKPEIILNKEIKTIDNKYDYKKVFKYKNVGGKKKVEINFVYGEEKDKYMISFEVKDKTFIYDVEFKKGHRHLTTIIPIDIKQNLKYQCKLDLFLEALKEKNEENKIDELYKETIELYSKKSMFSFFISLLSKIYENKSFCKSLLEKFYTMNSELKGKEQEKEKEKKEEKGEEKGKDQEKGKEKKDEKGKDQETSKDKKEEKEKEKKDEKGKDQEKGKGKDKKEEKGKEKKEEKGKNEVGINIDRDEELGDQFNSIMARIESESDNLITSNEYNPIHFYGVILAYFNYYDYNTFENCFNKLYKEKPENLYKILLVYYSQFLKPIKRDENNKEFFINFFEYIISEKDFSYFDIGLKFIKNIDTFIEVINKTKENIYEKYIKNNNKSPFISIQIDENLILKKEKIGAIKDGITSIYNYSKEIKKLLVYFKSDFWKSLLKAFEQPEETCFRVCLDLRKIFIEYNDVVKTICDPEDDKKIIKDIGEFYKTDDFAYHLNEKLKIFFHR